MNPTALSNIIAGTMTWGVWGKNFETNQMIDLIHCCFENGITSFDHADIYGGHTTEADFGNAFFGSNQSVLCRGFKREVQQQKTT